MCSFLGFSIYAVYKEEDQLILESFRKLEAFYIAFEILFVLRLMIRLYLICQWRNKKIDPSYADARIGFWQFLVVGTLEFGIWVYGIILLFQFKSIELHMTKDEIAYFKYSFYFIEIYSTIHSILYFPKLLAMLGIFAYIWYWGGFEKTEEGESSHIEVLEKMIEMKDFKDDNKELPENLEAANKIIV
jgi:hypothetical protein